MFGRIVRRRSCLAFIVAISLAIYLTTGPVYFLVKSNWEGVLYVKNLLTAKKYSHDYPTSTAFLYSVDMSLALDFNCTECLSSLTNAEYTTLTPHEPEFTYYDTDQLADMGSSLGCLPKNFGYSKQEGEEVFPWKAYPTCESQVKDPFPMIHIDLDTNLLSMNCTSKAKPKFLLGPVDNRKFTMRREVEDLWEIQEYHGKPVEIKAWHEFALGTCTDEEFFDQATYMLRPNFTAALLAKNNTRHWQAETGVVRRPLIVFMLVIDSYSRRHFFRKMPETVAFLNGLNKLDKYRVFDFKLHNTIGGNSVANQVPLLTRKG